MPEARLNFADHSDGTFSCTAVFLPPAMIGSSYNSKSHAHQLCRILKQVVDATHQEAPDDGMDEAVEVTRPTLETEAFMHFMDLGESFRLHRVFLPASSGFVEASPAHKACARVHRVLEDLCRADADAIGTRADGAVVVVPKERINLAQRN